MRPLLVLLFGCPLDEGTDTTDPIIPLPDTDSGADTDTVTTADIADFSLTVDEAMPLMIHAAFTDPGGTDAWVEYRFETDEWLVAPTIGPGEATILGIPELTEVEARAAAVVDGVTVYSDGRSATTGPLAPIVIEPLAVSYNAGLASPEGYVMIPVQSGPRTFEPPYVLEILDRAGRVVWYYRVPDNMTTLYASVARTGDHVWFEGESIFGSGSGVPGVTRRTLDGRWSTFVPIPDLGQAIGEGPDGSFFYEYRASWTGAGHGVNQVDATGAVSVVWDCDAHMQAIGRYGNWECLLNTTNWSESRNTVLASQFMTSTVFEIDLATGEAVRQFGQVVDGDPYTFDPPESMFAYQHFPNWTAEGTLLVSTHAACGADPSCDTLFGQEGIQFAAEYVVDDVAKTITRIGYYESTDLWATQSGEAYRLANGNLIQGYGQDGAVREVTPEHEVAWQVEWPKDFDGYRDVGHAALIGDLYAINQIPTDL